AVIPGVAQRDAAERSESRGKRCAADPGPKYPRIMKQAPQGCMGPGSRASRSAAMTAENDMKTEGQAIFTYSKSPGLLSMASFGGEIQPANCPGSYCGCIRLSM